MRNVAVPALLGVVALIALGAPLLQKASGAQIRREERIGRYERQYGFRNVVRGRVTDERGRPVGGVRVAARFWMPQSGMVGENDAETAADGRYEIRALGDNDFSVGVDVSDGPYLATTVQRADLRARGTTVSRDFVLREGPQVTIRVRDAETGEPIAGLDVHSARNGSGGPLLGQTDGRGEYSWKANGLTSRIEIGNVTDNASREAIGAAPGYSFFHEFRLVDARPIVWETKAYRKPWAPKPTAFRGRVVDQSGTPVGGAQVHFRQYNEERDLTTDREGRFSAPGKRILNFADEHQDDIVLFVDRSPLSATVRPTPEETWREMRIVVRRDGLAEAFGRVVDDEGKPARGCSVSPYEYFVGGSIGGSPGTTVGADGRFSLARLRPGSSLTLAFGGGEWGVTHVPSNWPQGKPLTLSAGERRDLGTLVVPHADAAISGVVTGPNGKPERRPMTMVVEGRHTSLNQRPDAKGYVAFPNVVREPLTIRVYSCEADSCSYGPGSKNELLVRPAEPGQRDLRLVVAWHAPQ